MEVQEEQTPEVNVAEETQARLTGWTPKEEFKGNAERWTDAATWNKKADELMPIMRANNRRLETDLGTTKQELAQLKRTMAQIVATNETISQREYDRALATIRKGQKEAIDSSDGDAFQALEQQKENLQKNRPAKIAGDTDADLFNQNRTLFHQRNANWYQKDMELTDFADVVGQRLAREGVAEALQFEKVETEVKKKFPHKFGNQRTGEQTVDSGTFGTTPTKPTKESYTAMPSDAKAACDAAVKSIKTQYPNRDEKAIRSGWVSQYFKSEA